MKLKNTNKNNSNGFTIIEVMIALAIIGISIGIFFGMIGNTSRLRGRIDDHAKSLLIARAKTEEAFLEILEENNKTLNNTSKENSFEGTTADGIQWKVTEIDTSEETTERKTLAYLSGTDTSKKLLEFHPKGTKIRSVVVEGINIDTIYFAAEKKENEDDLETRKTQEKPTN